MARAHDTAAAAAGARESAADLRAAKVLDLITRAEHEVSELCRGPRSWTMSIPARPEEDSDLVIGAALRAARLALTSCRRCGEPLDGPTGCEACSPPRPAPAPEAGGPTRPWGAMQEYLAAQQAPTPAAPAPEAGRADAGGVCGERFPAGLLHCGLAQGHSGAHEDHGLLCGPVTWPAPARPAPAPDAAAAPSALALVDELDEAVVAYEHGMAIAGRLVRARRGVIQRIEWLEAALAAAEARAALPAVLALIAAERARQVRAEGWTIEHDDQHMDGSLARAAACYALDAESRLIGSDERTEEMGWPPELWPWDEEWWKPTPDDRVRELVKAGALIVAEIERLLRAALRPAPDGEGQGGAS